MIAKLQTRKKAHASVILLFLLREVKLGNALEKLHGNFGHKSDLVRKDADHIFELSSDLQIEVQNLLLDFFAESVVGFDKLSLLGPTDFEHFFV